MYLIKFSKQADKDKKLLKGARLDGKAKELLNIIADYPFKEPPPYERLVGNLSGFYSRRINIQHRIVYEVYVQDTYRIWRNSEGGTYVDILWWNEVNYHKTYTNTSKQKWFGIVLK